MKDIAIYIRRVRLELGLTQAQFAEKIGSNRNNIAKYEGRFTVPPGNVLLKIQDLDQQRDAISNHQTAEA